MEIFSSPLYTVPLRIEMDAPAHIADESVLGPLLSRGFWSCLHSAKRSTPSKAQEGAKRPLVVDVSHHVQQITHPDVIRRFLAIALQRVRATADLGREAAGRVEYDVARTAFADAAELAAALVAFDTHTQGQYRKEITGARKELVLALGNASEMALRRQHHQQALHFSHGAVSMAENIAAEEDLDPSIAARTSGAFSRPRRRWRRKNLP
ncbi:hypothetical protein BU15DRAFT_62067 [Melanogaster broomeanus]|nr:hypothetical protein BU15DRAFT_62067 [Melanogaster broomeanus]